MTLDSKPGRQVQFADTLKLTELDGQVKQAVLPTSGANDPCSQGKQKEPFFAPGPAVPTGQHVREVISSCEQL